MTTGQWLRPSRAALRADLRRPAKLAHGHHQHVVKQAALIQIAHQRRQQVIEQRQKRAQAVRMPP